MKDFKAEYRVEGHNKFAKYGAMDFGIITKISSE